MTVIDRRSFLVALGVVWVAPAIDDVRITRANGNPMYGLIGKIVAAEGRRDELAQILLQGTQEMPGCLSYVVATDPADGNALWVTEVWTDEASHRASLSLPSVQAAISKGRPLIASFENRIVTEPLGGHGLSTKEQRN